MLEDVHSIRQRMCAHARVCGIAAMVFMPARTAAGKDLQPQELVDKIADEFQGLWDMLAINPDHFARTTLPAHREIVVDLARRSHYFRSKHTLQLSFIP